MKIPWLRVFILLLISLLLGSCNLLAGLLDDNNTPVPADTGDEFPGGTTAVPTGPPLGQSPPETLSPNPTPTPVPTPVPTPAIQPPAAVYFEPESITTSAGSNFSIELRIETRGILLENYNFSIAYEDAFLEVDESQGESGIASVTGNILLISNTNASGRIVIHGEADQTAPDHSNYGLRIYFTAKARGSSPLTITIRDFQGIDLDTTGLRIGNGLIIVE